MFNNFSNLLSKANRKDLLFLSPLVVLITWHPYYLHQKINLFELGLYLPGIDGILKGQVPYRDFFYLRGPLEIYVPAILMRFWGEHVSVLSTYFYIGTVIALMICVWIAWALFQTRLFLWIFVPVLIASTFTRVVFTYWGGMRYALGLIAMLLMVYFFKTRRRMFLFMAGITSALALMTSIEIGVCLLPAVGFGLLISMLYDKKEVHFWSTCFALYMAGLIGVISAFIVYMATTHSFFPFIESVHAVVFKSHATFATHLTSTSPKSLLQFLAAMVPGIHNFKYMTPMYLYTLLGFYFTIRFIKRRLGWMDFSAIVISVYGFILYLAAFRIIEGGQFETALQPEKILLFFILERVYFYFKTRVNDNALKIFLTIVVISSLGFSLGKYFHRFFVFKYAANLFLEKNKGADPLYGVAAKTLTVPRARGMVTTLDQGEEIEQVVRYIQSHSSISDRVFAYPDRGAYNFLMARPYVGRFPTACLSWMNERWHKELMLDLQRQRPQLAVLAKDPGPNYWNVYFTSGRNREHYDEVVKYIKNNYLTVYETPLSIIYKIKD